MNIDSIATRSVTTAAPGFNGKVSHLITDLLSALGEDPTRDGLSRTPDRVSRMYDELLAGYRMDLDSIVNSALFDGDYDEMVVVENIEFTSTCEHHLLPFYGRAHVAYLPDGKIIGLSKIPRIVDMFARRLQIQERMTREIAEAIEAVLKPKGVAVFVEGVHLCAKIRGVKKSGMGMKTRAMLGVFKSDSGLRNDFLGQLRESHARR